MKEIRRIIKEYESIDHSLEKVALASVVNVEESSYRRIGARMLVRSSGLWVGGISGGCLEGDALKRSQTAIFKNESSKVIYDTMEDDKDQIGVGLGCNGRIEVLFTPIDPNDSNNPIEQLKVLPSLGKPAVLLKIIDTENEEFVLGKSIIVNEDLLSEDFEGISKDELNPYISQTFSERKPKIHSITTKVGKRVKLLFEFVKPEMKLVIVGSNYDINAMASMASELGWEITIVGKPKKTSKSTFRLAKKVLDYREAENVQVDEYTSIVLMTHDFGWDKKILALFLSKSPAYIGMLGPKKRMLKMQKDFEDTDLESLACFHAPVGLDIGAETPEEIALSVCSEIVAFFRKRSGQYLKYREGTIHDRE